MNSKLAALGALFSVLIGSGAPAQAAPLESRDLFVTGDGLVTLDTATGLQWLDVTQTRGLSVDQVADGAGGWAGLGFRHASFDELKQMLRHAGLDDDGGFATPAAMPGMHGSQGDGRSLLDLIDGPASTRVRGLVAPYACGTWDSGVCGPRYVNGVWTDPTGYTYYLSVGVGSQGAYVLPADGTFGTYTASAGIGHWMVRAMAQPVPEPGTVLQLGLGLGVLAVLTRRRVRGQGALTGC